MTDSVPSWVTLTEDEQIVWSGHPTLWSSGRWLLLSVLLIIIGIVGAILLRDLLRIVSLVLIVLGLLLIVLMIANHRRIHYVITSEEVYKKTGLLSQNVTNLRIDTIQNTSFSQSFLQRLLRYGTVHIETAGSGSTELVIHAVSHPRQVNGHLTEQLDNTTQRGV